MDENNSSVYNLIGELCKVIFSDHNLVDHVSLKTLSNCRKKSFQILIQKSKSKSSCEDIEKQLNFHQFDLQVNGETRKAHEFETCLKTLDESKDFEYVQPMTELLLQLKNTSTNTSIDIKEPFLGCVRQTECTETPRPYPTFTSDMFELPLAYQHAFDFNKFSTSPYMPDFELSNGQIITNALYDPKTSPKRAITFFSDSIMLLGFESDDIYSMTTQDRKRQVLQTPQESSHTEHPVDKKLLKRVQYGQSWEYLGHKAVLKELPFATDSVDDSMLHLLTQKERNSRVKFQAKLVPTNRFIEDLRLLTIGIRSESFLCNNMIVFEMLADLTIPGVSPGALKVAVQEFLECGTCFKRLRLMIQKNPYNLKLAFDGFVFKALCVCIEKFLASFRLFVSSFQDETILGFASRITNIKKQLIALSRIVKIHPDVNNEINMPIGSEFLGYLYKEIVQVTQRDISVFLMFILKYCCHIYFSNFQKWIFNGFLQDPHKELFIYFVDHYRTNTKHFFDKAYMIRKQSVPGFLQGYEEDILLCGKYTMLLKTFKPTHPLFTLESQSLSVCLSYAQINQLRRVSSAYISKSIEICGQPVTVKQIFQERQKAKEDFYRFAEASSRINTEKWKAEQRERAEELCQKRSKLREQLQQQLKENEENRLAMKKAELALDRADLKQAQEHEDRLLVQENCARQKTIEYYQDLEKIIDEKRAVTDQVLASLQAEIDQNKAGDEAKPGECVSLARIEINLLEKRNSVMAMSVGSDQFSATEDDIADDIPEPVVGKLKRSASDTFNANEMAQTEFLKNKGRVLRSTLSELLFKPEDLENCNVEKLTTKTMASLTDAQKNRFKVLTQEYHIGELLPSDGVNNNVVVELSALQKNRSTMMAHTQAAVNEELTQVNKNRSTVLSTTQFEMDELPKIKDKLTLNIVETDRARNKRKVLQSEYDIITGNASTPSSVESGTPMDDAISGEPHILKLNTEIAKDIAGPDTFVTAATPFTALNTAGQQTKDGFAFPAAKPARKESVANLEVEYKLPLFTGQLDPLYTQLMDVISRRQNDFFGLSHFASDDDVPKKPTLLNAEDEELESLDSTTLTRFLQMSVVIPLNAHMEIINNEIMKMFLLDLEILDHFKSLRNYFFLMDGEFGSHICDCLLRKLESGKKPEDLLKYQTLHTILDTALGSSIIGNDKNAERLSFIVQNVPDQFDLKSPDVLNMLALSYHVQWPLNLVLNPETIEQYTKIFKYLIKVRRISWIMEQSFQLLKELHKKYGKEILLSPQYRHVQQIRHKLSHFMQALQNHITRTALQGSWKIFKLDLEGVRSMEDLYRKHTSYIKKILFLCMLNRRSIEFHNNVEDIFKVVLKFYRHLKAKTWLKHPTEHCFNHPNYNKLLQDEKDFEKLIKYTVYLGNKIVLHGYQQEIGEFINLININGYYDNTPHA